MSIDALKQASELFKKLKQLLNVETENIQSQGSNQEPDLDGTTLHECINKVIDFLTNNSSIGPQIAEHNRFINNVDEKLKDGKFDNFVKNKVCEYVSSELLEHSLKLGTNLKND